MERRTGPACCPCRSRTGPENHGVWKWWGWVSAGSLWAWSCDEALSTGHRRLTSVTTSIMLTPSATMNLRKHSRAQSGSSERDDTPTSRGSPACMRRCSCAKLAATSPSIRTGVRRLSRSWLFGVVVSASNGAPQPLSEGGERCVVNDAESAKRSKQCTVCSAQWSGSQQVACSEH